MRLLGSRANRLRRWRILPYILALCAGIVGGLAQWSLRAADEYQRLPDFAAQLGVELLVWGAIFLFYIALVLVAYWPDVKREIKRWRE